MVGENILMKVLLVFVLDVGSNDNIQYVKLDFVKAIIKETQKEILEELWHTTSDFRQEKRYELIYDKINKKLNKLKNGR